MNEIAGRLSTREERFEQFRQQAGLFLAPMILLVLWLSPFRGLDAAAHHLLAILGAVVTLWITEAVPLPVTALLGPAFCVLAGIGSAKDVLRGFADPIIFLFLGSFLIAEAMLHHGLNRRIAFQVLGLPFVGGSPARLLAAFAAITGFISMWVSNTATTAMMYPIAIAILTEMSRRQSEQQGHPGPERTRVRPSPGGAVATQQGSNAPASVNVFTPEAGRAPVQEPKTEGLTSKDFSRMKFGTGLMLVTAFAASIGGLGTPVGTPPNLIGLGQIEQHLRIPISFFQWMAFGVPLAMVLIAFLTFYLNRACPAEPALLANSAEWLRAEKAKLGPLGRGERNVLIAFAITVLLWLAPGFLAVALGQQHPATQWINRHFPEAITALMGGLLLFMLPVDFHRREFTLSWSEAKRIDWGTILLFGGGLALGELMFSTGLARWLGEGLAHALHARSTLGLVMLFTAVAIILSETTSNTASASMVVPVAIAVAQAANVDPLPPALAACLGASMGFMLPVSTPPNAIVYGSGCVPLLKMVKYGLLLDVAGFVAIVPCATWLVPWLMKI